jgi:hypothetical protein
MKTIIFLIFLSFSLWCNSQTWAPIGAKWYYSMNIGLQPELTVVESIGDSIMNGKQCQVLKSYMISRVEIAHLVFVYDTLFCPLQYSYYDQGKVYLYDSTLNNFRILYNFTAPIGSIQTVIDTPFEGFCPDAFGIHELFQYKVDSINDTVIDGVSLLRFHTTATSNADWAFSKKYSFIGQYPIMERIGSLKYIFGSSIWQVMEGTIRCLRCYQDSTLFYKAPFWPSNLPCDYVTPIYTNLDFNNFGNDVEIFPNPFQNYLIIRNNFKDKIQTFEILNLNGMVILSGIINENPIYISTDHLLQGLYFLKLKTDQATLFYKIIKSN